MAEQLIVYGATCVWWDSIDKAATKPGSGLPCCPHCGSVLLQVEEGSWWQGVDTHAEKESGYREFIEWSRGRCFPTLAVARKAYERSKKGINEQLYTEAMGHTHALKMACQAQDWMYFIIIFDPKSRQVVTGGNLPERAVAEMMSGAQRATPDRVVLLPEDEEPS